MNIFKGDNDSFHFLVYGQVKRFWESSSPKSSLSFLLFTLRDMWQKKFLSRLLVMIYSTRRSGLMPSLKSLVHRGHKWIYKIHLPIKLCIFKFNVAIVECYFPHRFSIDFIELISCFSFFFFKLFYLLL